MTTHWVCKYCIAKNGLRGADLDQWPETGDEAGIAKHLLEAHGITVVDEVPKSDSADKTSVSP